MGSKQPQRLGVPAVWLVLRTLVLCITVAGWGTVFASPGHWTTHDFGGQPIFTVAVDPRNAKMVYAGGNRGVLWKSTDEGATWRAIHLGSPEISMIHHLVIDPQHSTCLYASTASDFGGGSLFKSTDGGETWSLILKSAGPQVVVIDPQHPTVLYGTVPTVGLLKSVDGGGTWTTTRTGGQVSTLVLDPLDAALLYAGDEGGFVLKSADAGTTWVNLLETGNNGPVEDGRDFRIYSVNAIAAAPTQPTTLYVGTQGRGILKSSDGGTSWHELDRNLLYMLAVAVNPTAPAVLYAASYDSVFLSTDSGEYWQNLDFLSSAPPGINAITVNPRGTVLYVSTNGGISTYRLGQ